MPPSSPQIERMPRRCEVDPLFEHLVHAQDLVVSRGQALCAGLSDRAIEHRLASGGWQVLLPGSTSATRVRPLGVNG